MRIQVIALFLVSLYLASFVRAQTQGQITGVVTDSSGAVVAGAEHHGHQSTNEFHAAGADE